MVVHVYCGKLVARPGAGQRDAGIHKGRGEIEAVAGFGKRAKMDRLGFARRWSIFDVRLTGRRCATLVAARRWQDARR